MQGGDINVGNCCTSKYVHVCATDVAWDDYWLKRIAFDVAALDTSSVRGASSAVLLWLDFYDEEGEWSRLSRVV